MIKEKTGTVEAQKQQTRCIERNMWWNICFRNSCLTKRLHDYILQISRSENDVYVAVYEREKDEKKNVSHHWEGASLNIQRNNSILEYDWNGTSGKEW